MNSLWSSLSNEQKEFLKQLFEAKSWKLLELVPYNWQKQSKYFLKIGDAEKEVPRSLIAPLYKLKIFEPSQENVVAKKQGLFAPVVLSEVGRELEKQSKGEQ